MDTNPRQLMAETKFYEGYSRYIEDENRYETWDEAIKRVMDMHRDFYKDVMTPELENKIQFAEDMYKQEKVLGAQRALQFGGEQLLRHQLKLYNCTSTYVDRPEAFGEIMYMLLCGAGVGFSVQKHHVSHLPEIARRTKPAKTFVVPDSIEGWADAFAVLLSSYFVDNQTHPDYAGKRVYFDLNDIRSKGSYISGGFKAPGPDPLRKALDYAEQLIERVLRDNENSESVQLSPIHVYDIIMYMADAVIAGGVRRSATICLFSIDDQDMIEAKTGNWFVDHPQRGRSNNSAVCVRNQVTKEQFDNLMISVREFGEPGFVFTDSTEFTYNPCVEIGKYPVTSDGRSGIQGCNLSEINGGLSYSYERFLEQCEAASILGTLQAGYTDFRYLSKASKEIFEQEALIGVSVTGWMNNPDVLFDEQTMRDGARKVKKVNKRMAKMLGINPAARTTCVKPSGNASTMLKTASGIHGEHSPRYIRNVQLNKDTEVAQLLANENPYMIEESVWSTHGTDYVVSFPIEAPKGSIYRKDLQDTKQLEYVKKAQQVWVEEGTNSSLCMDSRLRHNVSNTITVEDWDAVGDYIYENRKWFAGISLIPAMGDKSFPQAPFTEVFTAKEIVKKYGDAAMFAAGLIVDGLDSFNDLWVACSSAEQAGADLGEVNHNNVLQYDFVRRFQKFADNFFKGDLQQVSACLKDVHNLHKWNRIVHNINPIDWTAQLTQKSYTDIDTYGAMACSGGVCEFEF